MRLIFVAIAISIYLTLSSANAFSSENYNRQRAGSLIIKKGEKKKFAGHNYRIIFNGKRTVDGMEILDRGRKIQQVNNNLLSDMRADLGKYEDCKATAKDAEASGSIYKVTIRPVYWDSRWLSISRDTEMDCVAHYTEDIRSAKTYDLESGKEINLWTWFNMADDSISALNGVVLDIAKEKMDSDCRLLMKDSPFELMLWIGSNGLYFYPQLPHVSSACAHDIFVPLEKLRPFLSPEGERQIKFLKNQ